MVIENCSSEIRWDYPKILQMFKSIHSIFCISTSAAQVKMKTPYIMLKM